MNIFNRTFKLRNPIQYYPWGSRTAIPELLGIPNPEAKPMAELWMGAHPRAPSQVLIDGKWISFLDLLKTSATPVLGQDVAARFSNQLPFLFKVLAAAEPLSIQVHPSKEQAMEGFERENRLGIPLDAPERNYRDDNHKPEMLCALTPFEALKGFRSIDEIVQLMDELGDPGLGERLGQLKACPDATGLKAFFTSIMGMHMGEKEQVAGRVVELAATRTRERREFYWIGELGRKYPGDIGVLSPLLLNLVSLQPGEAIFLPAGELHAYLRGAGLEIMANSDNVLRGGLTAKHVDVDELLRITNFTPRLPSIIMPEEGERSGVYHCPAQEFMLCRLDINGLYHSGGAGSVEILLCLEGKGKVCQGASEDTAVSFAKGDALLVPSMAHPYRVSGHAVLWKASVPS
ncbi:MAG: mannose-6-phosphate isomerase, class I [Deltaproteobacteria bacterium]|nr:mannose-6-phosphate isomerase, class I [Deltaproteobacteria bacterium]MBW2082707.1 mannose-6-phosphate isomerase, class I [Deltaproteobacteria bacterium]HDM09867.1 mannose-6-phosphate isomerase, class I [Desulfobacteraceae bacterium]